MGKSISLLKEDDEDDPARTPDGVWFAVGFCLGIVLTIIAVFAMAFLG